jgi:hypothetical protein
MAFKKAIIAATALATASLTALPAAQAAGVRGGLEVPGATIQIHSAERGGERRAGPRYRGGYGRQAVLPPRAIASKLRNRGFRRIVAINLRGDIYVARAWRRGALHKMRFNAYNGRMISNQVVRTRWNSPRYGRGSPRPGWGGPGYSFGFGFGSAW